MGASYVTRKAELDALWGQALIEIGINPDSERGNMPFDISERDPNPPDAGEEAPDEEEDIEEEGDEESDDDTEPQPA
jgi:hypothetical protein